MTYETIRLETEARGVTTLTLARPDRHNALSETMLNELLSAANKLAKDPATRVVVLAADGRSFCAGADLGWMRAQIQGDRMTRISQARRMAEMLLALDSLPKPVIGRVHAQAYGGGLGLMAVCDVVVAAAGARFALSETRLGLIPATIGPYVIARLGAANARRVLISARSFDASEARDMGLVSRVESMHDLDAAVAAEVAPYLEAAPGAMAAAKAHIRWLTARLDDTVVDDSVRRLADVWETKEASEGVSAFLEKRPPSWRK